MRGLNKVTLIGTLGKEPELRYTPSGVAVCSFSLAVNESYKGDDGQWVDKVEWMNITAWRKMAETCANYLRKGSRIYCEGKLATETYEKDGEKKYITKVVIREMIMLDKKGDVQNDTGSDGVSENAIELTEEETKGLGAPDDSENLPF